MFDPQRFTSGDEAYVRGIIVEHASLVRAACGSYARGDDHAEDLWQRTWILVFQKAHTYSGAGSFEAWLYRIATNVCRSDLRTLTAESTLTRRIAREGPDGRRSGGPEAGDPAHLAELRSAVQEALDELTERERDVVTLRVLDGRPTAETARILDVSPATVRSHLRHALNHLRRIMEDPESDLSRFRATP